MYRRPLGRARILASIAAAVVIVGCLLPWWTTGGRDALPAMSGNAFEGSGIVVFVVAVATLALVTLPYAMGDKPTSVDGWFSYLLLVIVAWLALLARVVDLGLQGAFAFKAPEEVVTRGGVLPLVALGLIIFSEAVFEMARDRR